MGQSPITAWLIAALLAVASSVAGSAPGSAQQTQEQQSQEKTSPPSAAESPEARAARLARLDALFASLKRAGSDAEAEPFVDEIWRLWTESGRSDVDAMMARALGGMQSRDVGLANLLLDAVIDMAPDFAEGWNRRATLRFLVGDHEGSLVDIDKTLSLEPRHFGALAGRAMIHAAAERWEPALADYKAALAINPFLPERLRVLPLLQQKAAGEGKKL